MIHTTLYIKVEHEDWKVEKTSIILIDKSGYIKEEYGTFCKDQDINVVGWPFNDYFSNLFVDFPISKGYKVTMSTSSLILGVGN